MQNEITELRNQVRTLKRIVFRIFSFAMLFSCLCCSAKGCSKIPVGIRFSYCPECGAIEKCYCDSSFWDRESTGILWIGGGEEKVDNEKSEGPPPFPSIPASKRRERDGPAIPAIPIPDGWDPGEEYVTVQRGDATKVVKISDVKWSKRDGTWTTYIRSKDWTIENRGCQKNWCI